MKPTDEQIEELKALMAEHVKQQRLAALAGMKLDQRHQELLLEHNAGAGEQFDINGDWELKPGEECTTSNGGR